MPYCFLTALGHMRGPLHASGLVCLILFSKVDSSDDRIGASLFPLLSALNTSAGTVKSSWTLVRPALDQAVRHPLPYSRQYLAVFNENYKHTLMH